MTVQQCVFQDDVHECHEVSDPKIATSKFLAWHDVSILLELLLTLQCFNVIRC